MKKNILIIGGSSGVGLALVKLLCEENNVIVASRTNETISDLPRPFKGLKQEVFIQDFSINVLGAIKTLQAVQNNLQNSETPSSVVLFSTVAVRTGMPFHSSVATAKGALEGLARSLAAELAPKVRFNVIAPSLVDTRMAEKFLNNETKKTNAASRHPLQRVGNAKEIAQMAKFLISDESSWMTAQTLTIDVLKVKYYEKADCFLV